MAEVFRSAMPAEMIAAAEVADYPRMRPGNLRFRVLRCLVPKCRPGDVFGISGGFQLTNDLSYPAETGHSLIVSPYATGARGHVISMERGANIGQQVQGQGGEHHKALDRTVHWQCEYVGDLWFAMVLVTGGGSNTQWGDVLKVDQHCGELTVARFRA